jgi:hypothetical protein
MKVIQISKEFSWRTVENKESTNNLRQEKRFSSRDLN